MIKQSLLVLACFLSVSQAWWRNGHLMTARVAYDQLSKTHPHVLEKANQMLKGLSDYTTFERDYPFVECASWADEIKNQGLDLQSHWHFVDDPFFDEGYQKPDWYPEAYNVTWALKEFVKYLSKDPKPQNDPQIPVLFGEGFNLRLMIHYVGDIHQPLHSVSRFTQQFPDGDEGGNFFMLKEFDGITELHALWDSVVSAFSNDHDLPLNSTTWQFFGDNSLRIQQENPRESFDNLDRPIDQWHLEGYQIASDFAYKNIQQNEIPSQEYLQQGIKIAERQIAKGGYRLANLLVKMWDKNHTMTQQFEEKTFLQ
ncbi:p1 s1 [Stylonychia lemnae]|uniref:p1 s1 n=1 Tax=Stylonychia lemnae TaxID=5949 RepID=A0A077ZUY3_STYLE|nr:p1 s1 [Stylonychia lemnae]|eukprot:CDW73384.1 p1 s1 [Stylonychia lemnae]